MFSLVGLFTAVSPFAADWNETHIYNPLWTPHAKFHNAQTMAFGAAVGVLTLLVAWRRPSDARDAVTAAVFASLYWVTQAAAALFPGVAFSDPEPRGLKLAVVLGVQLTQLHIVAVVLALVAFALWLALRTGSSPAATATVTQDSGSANGTA